MTRDEQIARAGRRVIMKELRINEVSMVDAPAGNTLACAVVDANSGKVEKLRGSDIMAAETAKRRRVMRNFRIDEISAVDRPAQAAALATIIKRADPPVEVIEQPIESYAFRDSDELRALDERLAKAAREREQREQEATMKTATTDATVIRKATDDAMASMNSYIAKRGRGVSRAASAEQWRKLHPAEFEALNRVGPSTPAPVAKRSASVDFMKLVDDVQREERCNRTTAMEIARKVHHDAFVKFQAASA